MNHMTMLERIDVDLKQAMIDKSADKLSVLRMLRSALRNKEISLRAGAAVVLTDEQVVEVIGSEIKKRRDSIEAYEQGGRSDLADKEKMEIDVLSGYMPEQLSDDAIEAIVREAAAGLGELTDKDFGKLMGAAMPRLKGKADGTKISQIVKKVLQK